MASCLPYWRHLLLLYNMLSVKQSHFNITSSSMPLENRTKGAQERCGESEVKGTCDHFLNKAKGSIKDTSLKMDVRESMQLGQ